MTVSIAAGFDISGIRLRRLALGAAVAALVALPAGAQTDTFQVTASVGSACTVAANDLAFGTYDPNSATPTDGSATLDVLCTNTTAYDVGLDEGIGSGATVASRKMTASTNLLNYSLYQESGRTTVWGENVGTDTVSGTGTGSTQTLTVYGRIFALQAAVPGAYADTITVTVTF